HVFHHSVIAFSPVLHPPPGTLALEIKASSGSAPPTEREVRHGAGRPHRGVGGPVRCGLRLVKDPAGRAARASFLVLPALRQGAPRPPPAGRAAPCRAPPASGR